MKLLIEDKNIDASGIYFTDLNDSRVFMSSFKGKAILIVGGAQRASKESEKWGKALTAAYKDSITLINVAFVPKQPPASMMSSIKNQLKRGYGKVPFLINWGSPSETIHLNNENLTHIFLIDSQGYLRLKFDEKYSEDALAEMKKIVNRFI